LLAQWFGAPVPSRFAARRRQRTVRVSRVTSAGGRAGLLHTLARPGGRCTPAETADWRGHPWCQGRAAAAPLGLTRRRSPRRSAPAFGYYQRLLRHLVRQPRGRPSPRVRWRRGSRAGGCGAAFAGVRRLFVRRGGSAHAVPAEPPAAGVPGSSPRPRASRAAAGGFRPAGKCRGFHRWSPPGLYSSDLDDHRNDHRPAAGNSALTPRPPSAGPAAR